MTGIKQETARSFFDFTDATAAVLDLLEKQLPDCVVFVAYHDRQAQLTRIVDFRGDADFGIDNGQTMPLRGGAADGGAQPDLTAAILANTGAHDVRSFVGIPLELHDGSHFGALCAVSSRLERFDRKDVELLNVLGRVIVHELDRELKHRDLQQRHDDLIQHNRRLRVDAFTDALTGVANRRGFERALAREWKLSRRGTVKSFLVLVDLDDFKAVNDRFGHAAGDQMLKLCAEALTDAGRETDVIGRIGGDEFAAVLIGCETGEEAQGFRERAQARLAELIHGGDAHVSFSAGHQALADASSPVRAMELADQAMYWQKRQRSSRPPRHAGFGSKIGGRTIDSAPRKPSPIKGPARRSIERDAAGSNSPLAS
ncbi:MAG: sensor domain-containing diguanylate cyclase [Solirubrobacterales bacterium]